MKFLQIAVAGGGSYGLGLIVQSQRRQQGGYDRDGDEDDRERALNLGRVNAIAGWFGREGVDISHILGCARRSPRAAPALGPSSGG